MPGKAPAPRGSAVISMTKICSALHRKSWETTENKSKRYSEGERRPRMQITSKTCQNGAKAAALPLNAVSVAFLWSHGVTDEVVRHPSKSWESSWVN